VKTMETAERVMRVLVVDDDEGMRSLLSVELADAGYSVLTASDGPEAVEILNAGRVDLLVTDYTMRQMNGLNLLWLSKLNFPEVPAVMMTGHADPVLTEAAHSCGALRVFRKPFPIEELLVLASQLRRAQQIPERVGASRSFGIREL
jgi:DNA-binding NtrC family response regulator